MANGRLRLRNEGAQGACPPLSRINTPCPVFVCQKGFWFWRWWQGWTGLGSASGAAEVEVLRSA